MNEIQQVGGSLAVNGLEKQTIEVSNPFENVVLESLLHTGNVFTSGCACQKPGGSVLASGSRFKRKERRTSFSEISISTLRTDARTRTESSFCSRFYFPTDIDKNLFKGQSTHPLATGHLGCSHNPIGDFECKTR